MEKNKVPQPGIIVGYHYPCVDGIYSMMNCFLSLKLYNNFNQDLLDILINEDLQNDYYNANKCQKSEQNQSQDQMKIEKEGDQQKQSVGEDSEKQQSINDLKQRLTIHSQDMIGFCYSDSFKLLKYIPCKIQQDPNQQIDAFFRFKQVDIQNSVCILLDYYGQSAQNLKTLCEKYKRVIVIDHHKTIESTFSELIKGNQSNIQKEQNIDTVQNNIDPQQNQKLNIQDIEENQNILSSKDEVQTDNKNTLQSSLSLQDKNITEQDIQNNSDVNAQNNDSTQIKEESKFQEQQQSDKNFIQQDILKQINKMFPNLVVIYNSRMSGASLTLDFFTKIFNLSTYLSKEVYDHLKDVTKLVEIYDTKFEINRKAEAFVANLLNQSYDFNARTNQIIFSKLINCYIDANIKLGERILDTLDKAANNLVRQKFVVNIGGKHNTIAKCYAVFSTNHSIINQTAHKLAELSYKDGMDNVGCFIINAKGQKTIKVSLRADNNPSKELKCHLIAQHFGGGGHPSASSFFTTFSSVKSWMK